MVHSPVSGLTSRILQILECLFSFPPQGLDLLHGSPLLIGRSDARRCACAFGSRCRRRPAPVSRIHPERHSQAEEKFYSFICWRGQIGPDLPGEINGTANHGSCCRGDRRSPGAVPRGCSSFKSCIISVVTVTERGKSHRWTRTPDSCIKACQGRFMPTRPPHHPASSPSMPQYREQALIEAADLCGDRGGEAAASPGSPPPPPPFIQPECVDNDPERLH